MNWLAFSTIKCIQCSLLQVHLICEVVVVASDDIGAGECEIVPGRATVVWSQSAGQGLVQADTGL